MSPDDRALVLAGSEVEIGIRLIDLCNLNGLHNSCMPLSQLIAQ